MMSLYVLSKIFDKRGFTKNSHVANVATPVKTAFVIVLKFIIKNPLF